MDHQGRKRKKRKKSVSFAEDVTVRDEKEAKNNASLSNKDCCSTEKQTAANSRGQSRLEIFERKRSSDKIETVDKKVKSVTMPKIREIPCVPDKGNTIQFVYSRAVERALTRFDYNPDERLTKSVEPLDFESNVSKLPKIYEDLVFMEKSKNTIELSKVGKNKPLKLPPISNGSPLTNCDFSC